MKTINPKIPVPETKARALTRALAYMMADRYVDQRLRNWQTGLGLDVDVKPKRRRR